MGANRKSLSFLLAAAMAATLLSTSPCLAQKRPRNVQRVLPEGPVAKQRRPGPANRPGAGVVERLMRMTPAEQRKFMDNNPRFQRLPAMQKENIRQRLDQFNALPEGERELLLQRFQLFRQLPAGKQQQARRVYRVWRELPVERRKTLIREFESLQGMTSPERTARFGSSEFADSYEIREHRILRALTDLLP
jgi:hypothetical protein